MSYAPRFDADVYQELVDHVMPDPLFVHDHSGRFRAVNSKACESLGYTREELLGMNVVDCELDFTLEQAQAVWSEVRSGVTTVAQGRHRRRDGSIIDVEVRFGLLDRDGERLYFGSVTDITERLKAERSLRENLAHARTVLDSMAEGVVLQDLSGEILDANPAASRILGLSPDQLRGRTSVDPRWAAIRDDGSPFPGDDHPAMRVLRNGVPVEDCLMGVRIPDTATRWIQINARPVHRGADGTLSGVICTFFDVTARRRAHQELDATRADLQAVLDNVPATIGYWNADGTCRFANRRYSEQYGLPGTAVRGGRIQHVLEQQVYKASSAQIDAARNGEPQSFLRTARNADGTLQYQQANYIPDVRDGVVHGVFVLVTDITELHRSHEQIRQLAQRLETVRDEERQAAAHTLHEGIAQDLFAARMTLEYLKTQAFGRESVTLACDELTTAIGHCITRTRQLANDLHPATLRNRRVSLALAEHARFFGEIAQLRIDVQEAPEFPDLGEDERLVFFRAAQEALTNVAKHARARTVRIALRLAGSWVEMDVTDDGIGVAAAAASPGGGLGLLGIRERAAALGGTLTIRSGAGGGTSVLVRLPSPAVRPLSGHRRDTAR